MAKTLGQVAYEAWRRDKRELPYGKEIAEWDIRPSTDHRSWQAAAEAVAREQLISMGLHFSERCAVIEAAKAYQKAFDEPYGGHGSPNVSTERRALLDAVEALKEAERE